MLLQDGLKAVKHSHGDRRIQTGIMIATFGLLLLTAVQQYYIAKQVNEGINSNRISITGQLFDRETQPALDEEHDSSGVLSTLWTLVPLEIAEQQYATKLIRLATSDQIAIGSKNAAELFHSMFDAKALTGKRRSDTQDLRRLFLYTENSFYHLHMGLDYKQQGIMDQSEWTTWNGMIREMHAHPILLAVIYQGYQNKYFSRSFARFLQEQLCSNELPPEISAGTQAEAHFKRGREFVMYFYPEMTRPDWPNSLPDYD